MATYLSQPDFDKLVRDAIHEYRLIQIESEFREFLKLVHDLKPRTIVEIGTASGASLWAMGQVCEPATLLIALDLPFAEGPLEKGPFVKSMWSPRRVKRLNRVVLDVRFSQDGQTYHRVLGDSHERETRRLVEAIMVQHRRDSIDLLFIDGDHSYEGAKADYELFKSLVRPGGVIAFHDIVSEIKTNIPSEVPRLWSELVADATLNARAIKDESDTPYFGNPARLHMGIGVVTRPEGAKVEGIALDGMGTLPWRLYRAGHLIRISFAYLLHAIGGLAKRLLRGT